MNLVVTKLKKKKNYQLRILGLTGKTTTSRPAHTQNTKEIIIVFYVNTKVQYIILNIGRLGNYYKIISFEKPLILMYSVYFKNI